MVGGRIKLVPIRKRIHWTRTSCQHIGDHTCPIPIPPPFPASTFIASTFATFAFDCIATFASFAFITPIASTFIATLTFGGATLLFATLIADKWLHIVCWD
jgi:hypothetical protein